MSVADPEAAPVAGRGPLAGLRVLDVTSTIVGPTATLILGEQGAEVIKVEPPEGDVMRRLGGRPREPGLSPKFLHFNRNKRSVVLDLKTGEGREVMRRLAERADVFVSNMRPRALGRLGLGWEALSALNPRLVHCTIVGFLGGGPYEGAPAYDTIIQGLSGVAGAHVEPFGEPRFAPFVLADHVTGITAAQAICAALLARAGSGRGQAIEVPMFETMAGFVLMQHLDQRTFDRDGHMGDPRIMSPDARPLRTRDGFICVSANTDAQVRAFFEATGRQDLAEDPRFSTVAARIIHVDAFFRLRAEAMLERPTAEWVEVLRRHDVPAMPCHTLQSLLEDPQLRASGVVTKEKNENGEDAMLGLRHASRYGESGVAPSRMAPRLGEHGPEILRELGYDEAEARRLLAARAGVSPEGVSPEGASSQGASPEVPAS
ncbi:CaiB/BaiF CoA transferase family protein [Roseomonas elaeocarpi]|uniref:CaiB/BaiF CoA transferase family protein n=1 Tax=Roseomonas elaeocarpi TaxID=907779 RepID=A0ABV6JMA8_9PROT